jgi:hypothetical protein
MGKALRVIGLMLMCFALVSCGGGFYMARLVDSGASQRRGSHLQPHQDAPAALDTTALRVTSALISFGLFVVGATLFSLGTYRFDQRRPRAGKKQKVTCSACSQRYPAAKLRCPACGEQNPLEAGRSRTRGSFLDSVPLLSELSGKQRAAVFSGISILAMLALAAFFLSM